MVFFQQQSNAYTPTLPARTAKYQEEPDWAPAPQQTRQTRDAAPAYFNSDERREMHMPRNSRETASYNAAIKAVTDAMQGSESEEVHALKGLWRVFDAGVGELGAELNDSLSNKAIFEACIHQETSERQGKPISQSEKNADAANRRQIYQSNLRSTLLRLRGSFADVLLGAVKDIQDTASKRDAEYRSQLENMEEKVRNTVQNDIQQDLQQEIQNRMNVEVSKVKEKAEMEIDRARGAADEKLNQAQAEVLRLNRELSSLKHETDVEINRLNRELSQAKHEADAEVNRLHRDLEAIRHSKDDTMAKLSSTLETLQTTCVNAQTMEKKLSDSEEMLHEAYSTQRDLRERVGLESERVTLLQNKLEAETQSKHALVRVKAEIEKHLSLERERADLLQQELESQKESQTSVLNAFAKKEEAWRGELEQASLMNIQLREQLKNANEAGLLLNQKVDVIQPRLDHSMNALSKISDKYSKLEASLNEVQSDNVQLVQSLTEMKDENEKLELLLRQANKEKDHLAEALSNAQAGIANLLGTVEKIKGENSEIAALFNEAKEDNTHLANALNGLGSEKSQLADVLEEARSNQSRLLREFEEAKEQVEQGNRKISELTANYEACEEALGAAKDDVNKLSSMIKSYKEDLDKKSELNSLLDAEVTRLEKQIEDLVAEKSKIAESLNLCKDHLEKSSEVNSIMATKVAKLEATVEDQVLELQAAKLSEADVESSLAESMATNEELGKKLDGMKHEVQMLTEKLRDECREKKTKVESLNEATQLLNDFERIIKELEERSKEKSAELDQMAQWNATIQSERDSLVQRIKTLEQDTIPSYDRTLNEKNELLNEMSEVVEALKDQIVVAEKESDEKIKKMELESLENAQTAGKAAAERIDQLELDVHKLSNELKNAMQQSRELEVLNDFLESECDSLREKISKCQEEYNTDRDKIAEALLGFDEEMTNAESKIKSVLDELEVEKKKASELSSTLSQAEINREAMESQMKSLQTKYNDLESECRQKQEQLDDLDKKQAVHDHELSVYQEALKTLQEKVDEAYGAEATTSTLAESKVLSSLETNELQKQHQDSLKTKNTIIEQNDEEIASLKEELAKEKSRLGRLQKLCFNAKQDLVKLQDQKSWLESSLKRSIDFIKQMKQSDNDTSTKRPGVYFDQLCLPMDASQIISVDGKNQGELQDFFTYIENQVTCTDGKDAQDNLISASNSW